MARVHLRQTKIAKPATSAKKKTEREYRVSKKVAEIVERLARENRTPASWYEGEDDPTIPEKEG